MNDAAIRMYDTAVIGGGAAGLFAAVTAADCGASVILLEHMDRVGKKLLATGNGKCNYTNALQGVAYYRGEDPAFVMPVFEQFGLAETLAAFQKLGVYPKEKNGYYYPASEQASAVLDVLRMAAQERGVEIRTSFCMNGLRTKKNGFLISAGNDKIRAKTIIFATGLLASPKSGSDGSAFPYIEGLGHHFIDMVPALVPLQAKQSFFKSLAGIRAEMRLDLYVENTHISSEYGEIQLTDYGISGIPVFQVSRYATKALRSGKKVSARIDFMPRLDTEALYELLAERFLAAHPTRHANECLIGLLNKKLIDVLLRESGIDPGAAACKMTQPQMRRLTDCIKGFRVDIIGSKTFEQAQVCAGGVDTREINNTTLESKLVPGVYFAGEVIDIDGTCGGYNLQWAWSSGYVAGLHAAKARVI